MSNIYQHKDTGKIVKVVGVDDRQDLASIIIDNHHSTAVWSEFVKEYQPYLGGWSKGDEQTK